MWWADFRHGGHRHRFSTGESDDIRAREKAGEAWAAIVGQPTASATPLKPAQDTVGAFQRHIEDLAATNRSPATIANYSRYQIRFDQFFPGRSLASLTQRDIEAWRDWLLSLHRQDRGNADKTLSPKLVSEHLNWLSAVYNHFGLANPTRRVHRPKRSHAAERERLRFLTAEQMRALFAACSDELRPSLTFLAYTGCRIGEMMGLRNSPPDIDRERQMAWVTGKGSKRRQLTLRGPAEPAWRAIEAEIERRGVLAGEAIFNPYDRWVDKRLRALCLQCGIPPIGPHVLRHTFASHALLSWGWNIGVLAKWLGHASIDTTYRIYGHLLPQEPPKIEW